MSLFIAGKVMELLKLFVLAGIAASCSGQMMGSGMEPMAPEPSTVIVVNATRTYRDLASYQQLYFRNGNPESIYERTAPNRYSRYNVSGYFALSFWSNII